MLQPTPLLFKFKNGPIETYGTQQSKSLGWLLKLVTIHSLTEQSMMLEPKILVQIGKPLTSWKQYQMPLFSVKSLLIIMEDQWLLDKRMSQILDSHACSKLKKLKAYQVKKKFLGLP